MGSNPTEGFWFYIFSLLQLLKMKTFLYFGDRFGSIDHNGASRVSKFTEKNRGTVLFYDFVHTVNGLELMLPFRHAALLFVHTLFACLEAAPFSVLTQIWVLSKDKALRKTCWSCTHQIFQVKFLRNEITIVVLSL